MRNIKKNKKTLKKKQSKKKLIKNYTSRKNKKGGEKSLQIANVFKEYDKSYLDYLPSNIKNYLENINFNYDDKMNNLKNIIIRKSFYDANNNYYFDNLYENLMKIIPKQDNKSWVDCENECFNYCNNMVSIEINSTAYILHLFSFKTPILLGKKIRKNVKSIVGISPTMVLLFHLPFVYLKM